MTSPFFSFLLKKITKNIMKYRPQSPTVVHLVLSAMFALSPLKRSDPKWYNETIWNWIPKWCRSDETWKWARCGTGGFQFPVAILAHFRQFSIKLRFLTSFQMTSWNTVRNREMRWNLVKSHSWLMDRKVGVDLVLMPCKPWAWKLRVKIDSAVSKIMLSSHSSLLSYVHVVTLWESVVMHCADHGSKKIKALHVFPGAQHSLLWGHAEDVRIQAAKQRYMQQWQACFQSFWQLLRLSMITWQLMSTTLRGVETSLQSATITTTEARAWNDTSMSLHCHLHPTLAHLRM